MKDIRRSFEDVVFSKLLFFGIYSNVLHKIYVVFMRKINATFLAYIMCLVISILTAFLLVVLKDFFSITRVLMLLLYIVVVSLPYILRLFRLKFPTYINILYMIFITLATLGGSVYSLYDIWQPYDLILHFISGVLLAAFAVYIMERNNLKNMTWLTRILFILGFAALMGVLWEIWEYSTDMLLDLNSQRYAAVDGVLYSGQYALRDTMHDLIADVSGAVIFTFFHFLLKLKQKNKT